ncbi:hypothetical protein [Bradyrhizobium sp. AUGA SZCCT0283]|uniref:hypothetical protein n=1 Tax=Bradyrhizobium sp. AUGA SZCCT0283 TaxID=2807671 RepID=UPI001BA619CD|nr:hypothetical protein [Bradyrhizobium sp. AUGA SZCCT0283]MBR1275088.1 hypothetical protein [Bradyrhizobium sp. AUGA SZCCT0283]
MRFDLWLADACRTADVCYDDFILTIATGGYPCLPGAVPGSPRTFDETDLLTLYIYGRLLAFGFDIMRAGEYAGRVHCALRTNADAKSVAIVLTPHGGKRVVVAPEPQEPARSEKIEFDVTAIRKFLNGRIERPCEEQTQDQ